MGLLTFFADRERKAELRESKDEMLIGEVVRAMAHLGYPSVSFHAGNDYQRVKFRMRGDPVLEAVYVTLDRKTGTGAISEAIVGSKATLHITCEVRNYLADPDDLVHMFQTDLANLFKISWAEVKVNHEYNAIHGTSRHVIDIDPYLDPSTGAQATAALLHERIQHIRDKLAPYKKDRGRIAAG